MIKHTAFGGLAALCLTTALALPALAGEVKVWTLTFSSFRSFIYASAYDAASAENRT